MYRYNRMSFVKYNITEKQRRSIDNEIEFILNFVFIPDIRNHILSFVHHPPMYYVKLYMCPCVLNTIKYRANYRTPYNTIRREIKSFFEDVYEIKSNALKVFHINAYNDVLTYFKGKNVTNFFFIEFILDYFNFNHYTTKMWKYMILENMNWLLNITV